MLQQLGAEKTLHLHGEGGEWLGRYGASGAPAQQVVWLGSRPVGLIQAGKVLYIESDHRVAACIDRSAAGCRCMVLAPAW